MTSRNQHESLCEVHTKPFHASHAAAGSIALAGLAVVLPANALAAMFAVAGLACLSKYQPFNGRLARGLTKRSDDVPTEPDVTRQQSIAVPPGASVPACPQGHPEAQRMIAEVITAQARQKDRLRQGLAPTDEPDWTGLTNHMSHELRTPLNAVLGFSEMLSSETLGPVGIATYSEYARAIHASGRQLLKSTEDALAITSILTSGGPAQRRADAIDIHSALDDALLFHATDLNHTARVITVAVADDLEVHGNAQIIRQLLINALDLIMNSDPTCSGSDLAIQATRNGDRVIVEFDTRRANDPRLDAAGAQKSADQTGAPASSHSFPLLFLHTLGQVSAAETHHEFDCDGRQLIRLTFPANQQADLFAD